MTICLTVSYRHLFILDMVGFELPSDHLLTGSLVKSIHFGAGGSSVSKRPFA